MRGNSKSSNQLLSPGHSLETEEDDQASAHPRPPSPPSGAAALPLRQGRHREPLALFPGTVNGDSEGLVA